MAGDPDVTCIETGGEENNQSVAVLAKEASELPQGTTRYFHVSEFSGKSHELYPSAAGGT